MTSNAFLDALHADGLSPDRAANRGLARRAVPSPHAFSGMGRGRERQLSNATAAVLPPETRTPTCSPLAGT